MFNSANNNLKMLLHVIDFIVQCIYEISFKYTPENDFYRRSRNLIFRIVDASRFIEDIRHMDPTHLLLFPNVVGNVGKFLHHILHLENVRGGGGGKGPIFDKF